MNAIVSSQSDTVSQGTELQLIHYKQAVHILFDTKSPGYSILDLCLPLENVVPVLICFCYQYNGLLFTG